MSRHRLVLTMKMNTLWKATLLISLVLWVACSPNESPADPTAKLATALQDIVDSVVAESEVIPGAALYVHAPALGLVWEGAAGVVDPATGEPMTPEHPVQVASNTKTYIAASILRLWEDGRIGLDDPISEHLPDDYVELLNSDGYLTDEITVRHLLTHTSGLYDYADTIHIPGEDPGRSVPSLDPDRAARSRGGVGRSPRRTR